MIDTKIFKDALTQAIKQAGFKKIKENYYLKSEGVVRVFSIQKSQYGHQYYVNCGISLNSLSNLEYPKEQNCQIRFRLTSIAPEIKRKEIEAVLDLENDTFSNDERVGKAYEIVNKIVLPLLLKCSSEENVLNLVREGAFSNALVRKEVKALL